MRKPKIVHILANGKRVKSIEGHVVPANNPVYEVLLQAARSGEEMKKSQLGDSCTSGIRQYSILSTAGAQS